VYGSSAVKKTGCYRIVSFVFLFHLCTLFVHFTAAAVINSRQPHRPQSVLTNQLSHKQAMPSLMSQQFNTLLTTDTTGPYSEETWTHTVGILKFVLILLSILYLSHQNSTVPSGFLPTILAILIYTYTVCPPLRSCLTSILLSFITGRIPELANSHISSSQISCKASSPTLKATQHLTHWEPEVCSTV